MPKPIEQFLSDFKINTKNKEVYELAFTHSSFNSDANTRHKDYERLEFMGDSVIGFVVASLIFKYHPYMSEGEMTKTKAFLVRSETLAKLCIKCGLDGYIKAGHSLTDEAAKHNTNILEDIFEAVMGAIYIDQGIEFATKVIRKIFIDEVINYKPQEHIDYKSTLQEAMQAEYRSSVTYRLIGTDGPPHDRVFHCEVLFNDVVLGKGSGRSKKEAEQNAAKEALSKKAT